MEMPGGARSYLAFDFGTRRVGVASGNTVLGAAQPLQTLTAAGEPRFVAIARLISEWQPDALVVGVPFHPNGAEHENTHRARRFARQLHGRFGLPVHEVDERYSTVEAEAAGPACTADRTADRTAAGIDAAAAAVILDQFLHSLPDDDAAA